MRALEKVTYRVSCTWCKEVTEIKAHEEDVQKVQNGEHIARAMPYLNIDERELLISGTCPKCWDKMMGGTQ